jgi:hypothetical protein
VDGGTIVEKPEVGVTLTPDELSSLKLLMVGGAEYYMKYDDDFDRSESELKRIVEEIRKLQARLHVHSELRRNIHLAL